MALLSQQAEAALLKLLPTLDGDLVGVEALRIFLLLTELLHVIQKHKKESAIKLAEGVAAAFQQLSAESVQVIGTVENDTMNVIHQPSVQFVSYEETKTVFATFLKLNCMWK